MEFDIQLGNGYTVCININNLEKKEEIRSSNSNFNTLLNWDVVKHGSAFVIPQCKLCNHQHSVITCTFLVTNSGKTSFIKLAISNKTCINLNICYNNNTIVKVQATKFLGIQNHNNSNCKTHTARNLH